MNLVKADSERHGDSKCDNPKTNRRPCSSHFWLAAFNDRRWQLFPTAGTRAHCHHTTRFVTLRTTIVKTNTRGHDVYFFEEPVFGDHQAGLRQRATDPRSFGLKLHVKLQRAAKPSRGNGRGGCLFYFGGKGHERPYSSPLAIVSGAATGTL